MHGFDTSTQAGVHNFNGVFQTGDMLKLQNVSNYALLFIHTLKAQ